ncbi:MAG: sigma-70 family RNA polymerase sigma factor [Sarcina sp.]
MEDKLIVKNIKRKKECGLEMFIDKYGGLIKAIIRKKLYNYNSNEDECLDDILLAIWDNISRFDESKGSLRNWIISVARYKVIDYNRRYVVNSNKVTSLNTDDGFVREFKDENAIIDKNILSREINKEIDELLGKLSKEDKELFVKHYLEEKSVTSISKEVGVKTDVLYNRLSRGRVKLKSILVKSNLF